MHAHQAAAVALAVVLAPIAAAAQVDPYEPGAGTEETDAPTSIRYLTDAGYALTFPASWWVNPEVNETVVERPEGTRVRISLMAEAPPSAEVDGREGCHVSHRSSEGRDLESLASEAAEAADVHEDVVQQPAEVSLLELPVGPAARLDYTHAYPAFTTATTVYLFVDGSLLHALHCSAPERPDDGWMSIAGTWEFLAD